MQMTTTTPHKKSASLSLIGKSFSFIFNLLLLAFLAWMLLLLLVAVGFVCYGWETIWSIFEKAILGMSTHLWVSQLGLDHVMQQANGLMPLPESLAWAFPVDGASVAKFIHGSANAWVTFLLVTQFVVERCQVFAVGSMVIFLFALLGLIDGLVQRDIRKFQNARESTLFFHRSKSFLSSLFFAGYFLFILVPMDIPLTFCLTLIALATAYWVQVSTKQFKKHV
jgi:hypothetical protein